MRTPRFYSRRDRVESRPILDDADNDAPAFDPPDADAAYARYLVTCRRPGVAPVPRERALGLMQEWGEVLSGRPEPTQH